MIHFISGLPRSGSTLLAALLQQNPRFTASFQSPLGQVVTATVEQMGPTLNEGACLLTPNQRERMLRGLFYGYYFDKNIPSFEHVTFDNNRRWCAQMALLYALFPGSRVIACVRDPRAILDSFERLFQKNPTQVTRIVSQGNTNVYQRIAAMLESTAAVGYSLNAFREAYYGPFARNLLLIDFYDLVERPIHILTKLHEALGEDDFSYDINNIAPLPGADEFDRNIGLPGLHQPRARVHYEPQPIAIPPDLIERMPLPFWLVDDQKNPGVKVLR